MRFSKLRVVEKLKTLPIEQELVQNDICQDPTLAKEFLNWVLGKQDFNEKIEKYYLLLSSSIFYTKTLDGVFKNPNVTKYLTKAEVENLIKKQINPQIIESALMSVRFCLELEKDDVPPFLTTEEFYSLITLQKRMITSFEREIFITNTISHLIHSSEDSQITIPQIIDMFFIEMRTETDLLTKPEDFSEFTKNVLELNNLSHYSSSFLARPNILQNPKEELFVPEDKPLTKESTPPPDNSISSSHLEHFNIPFDDLVSSMLSSNDDLVFTTDSNVDNSLPKESFIPDSSPSTKSPLSL